MFKLKLIKLYALTFLLLIVGRIYLKEDFLSFFKWWFLLLVMGVLFLPVTRKMFHSFHDGGYLFSKVIGVAISGYLLWLLSSLKLLKFTSVSCYQVLLICFILNIIVYQRSKADEKKALVDSDNLYPMIAEEVLFLFLFFIWAYIRGFKPEAYGTEKFMDYGFMAAMMRSDYMPPRDLWFSGSTINYYYVGQYMATYLTKLSLNTVNVGYNLMLTMLAALSFVLPYSLVYNITKKCLSENGKIHKWIPRISGILSGAGVSLAGNLHFTLYYWVVPTVRKILGIEGEFAKYWFPNSTRYIGYNPETTDKTIHEFPSYSFILGDLHAHVINIIFVLTILGILFAWLLYQREKMKNIVSGDNKKGKWTDLLREIWNPFIISIGFFIGLFHTTNFWDYPIYYVVAGGVILFSNAVTYQFKVKTLWITALQGIFIVILSEIIVLPFTLSFDQIATEIMLVEARTPLYQLLILWGLPVTLILGFLFELVQSMKIVPKTNNPKFVLFRFLNGLSSSDLFILVLGLCAIGLVMIPEVIYVKDIYSGDYKRANTMFKLTYQAFIMFGICSGYIFVKFKKLQHFHWQKNFIAITLFLFLTTLWYPMVSIKDWYIKENNFLKGYVGLDGAMFLNTTEKQEDHDAIRWLNEHIDGTPVILEAHGESYSDYGRVSVFTGLPTVLGWYVHEWLWRGDTEVINERAADIQTIFTSTDINQIQNLIDKYEIEYIYVGNLERSKYQFVNDNLIKQLGELVYSSWDHLYGSEVITDENSNQETYIIKVEPKG